jgi:hypothetical protein
LIAAIAFFIFRKFSNKQKVAAIIRLRQTIVAMLHHLDKTHRQTALILVITPIFLVKVSVATQMQHHLLHRLVVLIPTVVVSFLMEQNLQLSYVLHASVLTIFNR